jgi:hypothetical protein
MPPNKSEKCCALCRKRKRKCSGGPAPCKLCANLARETGKDSLTLCVFPSEDSTAAVEKLRQAHEVVADMMGKLLPLQLQAAQTACSAEKEAFQTQQRIRNAAIKRWSLMNSGERNSEEGQKVYRMASPAAAPGRLLGPERPGNVLCGRSLIEQAGFAVETAPTITDTAGSSVWVVQRNGRLWRCKIPNSRSAAAKRVIEQELAWLQWCLGAPNIVQLGGSAGALRLAGQICGLISDHVLSVPYQHLTNAAWTKRKALGCMRGLFTGIISLHSRGFIHGNLNPSSVLIHSDRSNVTIVDLERARMEKYDAEATELYGDSGFRAPELHRAPAARTGECIFKAEVWAAGITCVCMMLGSEEVWTQEELGQLDWRTGTRGHMQDARAHTVAEEAARSVRNRKAGAGVVWLRALRPGLILQEAWFEWLGTFPLHCQNTPHLGDRVKGRATAHECLQTLAILGPE